MHNENEEDKNTIRHINNILNEPDKKTKKKKISKCKEQSSRLVCVREREKKCERPKIV